MESLITRYRNVSILVVILFAQVLGLAIQVRRSPDAQSTRLIRVWAVAAVTPFEKVIVWTQSSASNLWHSYIYLRGVRQENRDLKYEIETLRIRQVRLSEDAEQARRLQALLGFKEQFILKTLPAQVIGVTGSELSRGVYIDKGRDDGVKRDMAVITSDGVVGKVLTVYGTTALVLLLNDQTNGVGAVLAKSRLQGILRGTPSGEVVLEKILSDEVVEPGEQVLTSGGDQIFPKGLPAGTVTSVSQGPDSFLNIRIRPAANLSKLEEVLVITQQVEAPPAADAAAPMRAADILAQRLPSVPDQPAADAAKTPAAGQAAATPNTAKPVVSHGQTESTPVDKVTHPRTGPGPGATPSTSKPAQTVKPVPGPPTEHKPAESAPNPTSPPQ